MKFYDSTLVKALLVTAWFVIAFSLPSREAITSKEMFKPSHDIRTSDCGPMRASTIAGDWIEAEQQKAIVRNEERAKQGYPGGYVLATHEGKKVRCPIANTRFPSEELVDWWGQHRPDIYWRVKEAEYERDHNGGPCNVCGRREIRMISIVDQPAR